MPDLLKRAKTHLTSRTTVLVLILLLTAVMTVAVTVPQTRLGADAPGGAPPRALLVTRFGLDHVFSTWWFAALAVVFIASLVLSTFDQLRLCRSRTFRAPGEGAGGVPCALGRDDVERLLRAEGYRRLSRAPGRTRHVRWWQGYWGAFLLHAGMTVTVVFSLLYVLTEHRVRVRAISGVGVPVDPATQPARRGLLARPLALPSTVTLFKLEPAFWENDQLKDLSSQLVFTDPLGRSEDVRVGSNLQHDYRGVLVYQEPRFGNAFVVQLEGGAGSAFEVVMPLPMPARRDEAAYGSFPLAEPSLVLKAKYYASADRTRMLADDPQLVLRLYEGERLLGETALLAGESAPLGPYRVRLARVGWWTDLLLEGSVGTPGIFTGFALLLLGATLVFFAVPREAIVRDSDGGCMIEWRTTRFPDFYREEGERILARCTGGSTA